MRREVSDDHLGYMKKHEIVPDLHQSRERDYHENVPNQISRQMYKINKRQLQKERRIRELSRTRWNLPKPPVSTDQVENGYAKAPADDVKYRESAHTFRKEKAYDKNNWHKDSSEDSSDLKRASRMHQSGTYKKNTQPEELRRKLSDENYPDLSELVLRNSPNRRPPYSKVKSGVLPARLETIQGETIFCSAKPTSDQRGAGTSNLEPLNFGDNEDLSKFRLLLTNNSDKYTVIPAPSEDVQRREYVPVAAKDDSHSENTDIEDHDDNIFTNQGKDFKDEGYHKLRKFSQAVFRLGIQPEIKVKVSEDEDLVPVKTRSSSQDSRESGSARKTNVSPGEVTSPFNSSDSGSSKSCEPAPCDHDVKEGEPNDSATCGRCLPGGRRETNAELQERLLRRTIYACPMKCENQVEHFVEVILDALDGEDRFVVVRNFEFDDRKDADRDVKAAGNKKFPGERQSGLYILPVQ